MQMLTGYTKPVIALAFSHDDSRLFSAAKGQSLVWEWSLSDGTVLRKRNTSGGREGIHALATSRGGHLLASGKYGRMMAWDPDNEEYRNFTRGDHPYLYFPTTLLALSPDGQFVAAPAFDSTFSDNGVYLWTIDGAFRHSFSEHKDKINALAFSPDGTLAAACKKDVSLWDVETRDSRHVLKHKGVVTELSYRPDGKILAAASGKSIFVWDAEEGTLTATLTDHADNVTTLIYSPDGKYLASTDKGGFLILHDARTGEVVGQRHLDVGSLCSLSWRFDSTGLAAGGDKLIALYSLDEVLAQTANRPRSRGEPLTLSGHSKYASLLAYSPDGRTLASAEDQGLCLWDLSAGAGQAREKASFEPAEHPSTRSLSWSRDSKVLAHWSPPQLRDGETGALRRAFITGEMTNRHFSFLPSGRLLRIQSHASSGCEIRLYLLDAVSNEEFAAVAVDTHNGKWDYDFHTHSAPDGRNIYFCLGQRNGLRWDSTTGQVDRLFAQNSRIGGLIVREDERLLVTLGGNSALVWNLPGGTKHLDLKHPLICSGAAFLPHGRLLTSCYDGLVRVWDLSGGSEIHTLDLEMGKIYSLAASPDHMTFAAGVEKKSRIVLMDIPE